MKFTFVEGWALLGHKGNYIYLQLPVKLGEMGHEVVIYDCRVWSTEEMALFNSLTAGKNITLRHISQLGEDGGGDFLCIFAEPWLPPDVLNGTLPVVARRYSRTIYWSADCWIAWNYSKASVDGERVLMQIAQLHLANSPQNCVRLQRLYKVEKVYWLPNAARQEWYVPLAPPNPAADIHTYCTPEGKYIVSLVGYWVGYRNIEELVRVAPKFRNLVFVLVGELDRQRYHYSFSHAVGGNVFFVGPQSHDYVRYLLASSLFAIVAAGRNWFSYFSDPTKWYLYHAAGVPILSLNIPHHSKFRSFYPNTVCAYDYETGIWKMLESLEKGVVPVRYSPLPLHDYAQRAEDFLAILGGENPYGVAMEGRFHPGIWLQRTP